MSWTPSPETHRVDAITDSFQEQDSIFQMFEAGLHEFLHINDILLQELESPNIFQPQEVPPPEEPQTLPHSFTVAELDAFLSGRVDTNDIFLSQGLEPISFQPQDVPPPEEPETHFLDAITDSSGRIQDDPAMVQPQDSVFQMPSPLHLDTSRPLTEAELDEEPATLPSPSTPRLLTEADIDEFTDSSGMIDFNGLFLSQGLVPVDLEPEDVPPSEEAETPRRPFRDSSGRIDFNAIFVPPHGELVTLPHLLTDAELDEFRDSWGRLDFNAVILSQRPQPPEEPQSKGLSEETISKYLKTMNADEIRAHDKDGDRRICAVCLDDMCGQKDIVAILDDCGHEFHYCCLKTWLRRKNICPLCRRTAISLLGDD